jgi:hypothetical protein
MRYNLSKVRSKEGFMKKLLVVAMIIMASGFVQAAISAEAGLTVDTVPRITKEQVKAQLGSPDLVIIDVRSAYDLDNSKVKIKGSIREDPYKIGGWINKYPKEKTIVFSCN